MSEVCQDLFSAANAMLIRTLHDLKSLSREDLQDYLTEHIQHLTEDEAHVILDNPYCSTKICQMISQTQRLTSFYSVRLRLVAHRRTPQAHAVKFVHYLYWPDLVRLSVEVQVPATVRRAIDTQLLIKVTQLPLGEKVSSARRCSNALIKVLLFDPDPKVFAALLINQRLREDDLILLVTSERASVEQLRMLAADQKWSYRYAIRKALVMNPKTPRSSAASQLRFLTWRDLRHIHSNPDTSVYLRRCIERMDVAPAQQGVHGRLGGSE